jgi:hypothetical protein
MKYEMAFAITKTKNVIAKVAPNRFAMEVFRGVLNAKDIQAFGWKRSLSCD